MSLTLIDEFCGAGGSSSGASLVPGVELIFAANHWQTAIETHAKNFPWADHYCGDIAAADVTKFPAATLAWHSPACPPWSNARGQRVDFDAASAQLPLWGEDPQPLASIRRARALMEEIPRYLAACALRGRPVLAGVVENVVEVVKWVEFRRWRREIEALGYKTWVIALNSMHAHGPRGPRAPQSRDRFYLAYCHRSLRRVPDWNKWLRPLAFCTSCDKTVYSVQAFKKPDAIMGRYRAQYVYRCPNCRRVVEPEVLAAAAAIDWSDLGQVIGERENPLAEKTMKRIRAGFEKYVVPFTVPTGGTRRKDPSPLDRPHPTQLTRESDGLVVPPLAVPMEGREGKAAAPITDPMRTQTARAENALVFPPNAFLSSLRGGGSKTTVYPATGAAPTVSASGNHLSVTIPDAAFYIKNFGGNARPEDMAKPVSEPFGSVTTRDHHSIVVPYYSGSDAQPVDRPIGTIPTRDHWALASLTPAEVDRVFEEMVSAARFRMLHDYEIHKIMAFLPGYQIAGTSKRARVRQLGNAVTPPAAEVLMSALVECVTGEELERYATV